MNNNKYTLIRFNLKSFHPKLLEKNLLKIKKKVKLMNIYSKGIIFLPLRKKRFTVLRSPHVYKKAREQFEIRMHHRCFITVFDFNNDYDKKKAKLLINFVKASCAGAQLKITYKNFHKTDKKFYRY